MLLACSLSLLLFTAPYCPQEPPQPAETSYMLRSGEALTGYAKAIAGDRVVMHVVFMDGSATIRRRLTDFTPVSQFRIHLDLAPPTDFADHMVVARRAIELGILPQAGEHAGIARRLAAEDPTGEQTKTLNTWAAATLAELFDGAIRQDDGAAARHFLRLISSRVPERFTEEQLGTMADQVAAVDAKRRTSARGITEARSAAARREQFDQAMLPVQKQVERADELVRNGLRNARSTVQATNHYEKAIAAYRSAWVDLQALLKQRGLDPADQEDGAELVQRVKDSAMQAILHAGNATAMQGDYRAALAWASKGLLMDAENEEAKALIRTIQIAQSSGGPWGGWSR